jgi:hypothetical protein
MIRSRALLIAAGYPDASGRDALGADLPSDARPEAMDWRNGPATCSASPAIKSSRQGSPIWPKTLCRVQGEADNVRRFATFRYGARNWKRERHIIVRIEASGQGADVRFGVINLTSVPRWLYKAVPCQRGQAENFDQGAQAALRLGPHLMLEGDRQPSSAS